MKRTFPTRSIFALFSLVGCGLPDRSLGELATDGGTSTGDSTIDPSTSTADPSMTGPQADTGSSESGEPQSCEEATDPPTCKEDYDRDDVRHVCDNAPDYFNPSQIDFDSDGFGDVDDLCPTVAAAQNTADSDRDGIGNACDSCPSQPSYYNIAEPTQQAALVRSIPDIGDADGDGIGDACDNCVVVPNCGDYSSTNPWNPGYDIPRDDPNLCQSDADQDMIGDACEGSQAEGAAGPVGFLPDDDFDQDGLTNAVDACVRLPLPTRVACDGDDDCAAGARCDVEAGLCNHVDSDGDLVGDVCDTCAFAANGQQLEDGGMQEDDEDEDFVGSVCEAQCSSFHDPAPQEFWSLSSGGRCCTTLLHEEDGDLFTSIGRPLLDPDGLPVRVDCEYDDFELRTCSRLPDAVAQAPGVLTLPPGCSEAGEPIYDFVDGNPEDLWTWRCEMPQWDQDFDGIGDKCDFCPFSFDPDNTVYVDDNGVTWPHDGKYCNGEYSIENTCGE